MTDKTELLEDHYNCRAMQIASMPGGGTTIKDVHDAIEQYAQEREVTAYDNGYDAGRNAKPAKLVDAIEFRREQYGWNKSKMAAMLDMTKPNYSDFIAGRRGLPINSVRKAYAIGIPADILLQDDTDRRIADLSPKKEAR